MDQNLKKYVGTVVKLVSIANATEIYGYLEDWDEKSNRIKLNKAIWNLNRMIADGAGTMHSIIKYDYKDSDGNVITVPASTVFPNAADGKHISYFDLSQFIFIPLYDSSYNSEKKLDKPQNIVQVKTTFEDYIEHIYNTYGDVLVNINELTTEVQETELQPEEKDKE